MPTTAASATDSWPARTCSISKDEISMPRRTIGWESIGYLANSRCCPPLQNLRSAHGMRDTPLRETCVHCSMAKHYGHFRKALGGLQLGCTFPDLLFAFWCVAQDFPGG